MAKVKVLVDGYLSDDRNDKAAATISLVVHDNIKMVVDPGFLEDKQILIDALKAEGLSTDDINFIFITHSHLDHYRSIGMFPNASIIEYFGQTDKNGMKQDWKERLSDHIQIMKTLGHDHTSITLFVKTDDGVVAICGDVFWKENYPEVDPYAVDLKQLDHSRQLVQEMSHYIIPGHAGMYKTKNGHRLEKVKNGSKTGIDVIGKCRKCHKLFTKITDKCFCQEWLCYRCCECAADCKVCNCKERARN